MARAAHGSGGWPLGDRSYCLLYRPTACPIGGAYSMALACSMQEPGVALTMHLCSPSPLPVRGMPCACPFRKRQHSPRSEDGMSYALHSASPSQAWAQASDDDLLPGLQSAGSLRQKPFVSVYPPVRGATLQLLLCACMTSMACVLWRARAQGMGAYARACVCVVTRHKRRYRRGYRHRHSA